MMNKGYTSAILIAASVGFTAISIGEAGAAANLDLTGGTNTQQGQAPKPGICQEIAGLHQGKATEAQAQVIRFGPSQLRDLQIRHDNVRGGTCDHLATFLFRAARCQGALKATWTRTYQSNRVA